MRHEDRSPKAPTESSFGQTFSTEVPKAEPPETCHRMDRANSFPQEHRTYEVHSWNAGWLNWRRLPASNSAGSHSGPRTWCPWPWEGRRRSQKGLSCLDRQQCFRQGTASGSELSWVGKHWMCWHWPWLLRFVLDLQPNHGSRCRASRCQFRCLTPNCFSIILVFRRTVLPGLGSTALLPLQTPKRGLRSEEKSVIQ